MNKVGSARVEAVEIESFQERELLQCYRPLAPWAGLAHDVAVVVAGQRSFEMRRPTRHVIGGEHAPVSGAPPVHDFLWAGGAGRRPRGQTRGPLCAGRLE